MECCRGRGRARERTGDRGRGQYRGRGRECCRGRARERTCDRGGDIIEGGEENVVGGGEGLGRGHVIGGGGGDCCERKGRRGRCGGRGHDS